MPFWCRLILEFHCNYMLRPCLPWLLYDPNTMVLSAVGTGQGLQLLGEALPQSMWDDLGEWKQVVPLALSY